MIIDDEDECSGCEGWSDVDSRGLCPYCADEIDNRPCRVIESFNRTVVDPGPFTQDQAEHLARMHNDSLRYADRGVFWRMERIPKETDA